MKIPAMKTIRFRAGADLRGAGLGPRSPEIRLIRIAAPTWREPARRPGRGRDRTVPAAPADGQHGAEGDRGAQADPAPGSPFLPATPRARPRRQPRARRADDRAAEEEKTAPRQPQKTPMAPASLTSPRPIDSRRSSGLGQGRDPEDQARADQHARDGRARRPQGVEGEDAAGLAILQARHGAGEQQAGEGRGPPSGRRG